MTWEFTSSRAAGTFRFLDLRRSWDLSCIAVDPVEEALTYIDLSRTPTAIISRHRGSTCQAMIRGRWVEYGFSPLGRWDPAKHDIPGSGQSSTRPVVDLNLPLVEEEEREVSGEGGADFVPPIHMYPPQANPNTGMENTIERFRNLGLRNEIRRSVAGSRYTQYRHLVEAAMRVEQCSADIPRTEPPRYNQSQDRSIGGASSSGISKKEVKQRGYSERQQYQPYPEMSGGRGRGYGQSNIA
ncbi:hypothetical protein OWV82_010886 [Melia azedarach]|uniref:Uncharacterized protein n=1 Tax=Melia azedarach TaxID=155640 RepID=A0ACC1Y6H0_MELAZ|nr:hypothetical protein OWV82_010886 [Melia azedarach]